MTPEHEQEIAANLERAEKSIQAAKDLAIKGYHDFAASRAYYAAFYGATAVLLNERLDFGKHSGVIASIHQRFVKTGKLSKQQGKDLNWLFEIRNVGDYGGAAHVSHPQAELAIQAADSFLKTIKSLLNR
ncbi:HEPN domain-containing protein [Candidatus Sumerlaeota bacterium]|nr:HEPN domain-containing protein [Candidatus Sumerlaeota bacterium]